jgi:GNAT superfamily N-acetyltransferase
MIHPFGLLIIRSMRVKFGKRKPMDFATVPASNYPAPELAELLNRGFEDYFIPIQFNTNMLLTMLHKDGIDLAESRLLIADDQPCGIALIARRGAFGTSRLAAMGIEKGLRSRGAGSWFMQRLLGEARQRGDHEMVLEVIEQNEPAVRLYQRSGFENVRRLIGFLRKDTREHIANELQEFDLQQMGRLISQHGLSDLPWQLSGESIAQLVQPARAYRNGQAYVVVSNPEAEQVVIWSLLVEQNARGNGLGARLLESLMATHTGKTWHVPALFPEELAKVFERAGFERENLSQWQMKVSL